MDTKDIRGFIRSFELRSINKAAGDLFISPQGLGKAINRLEAELGVKLFDRTPNGLVPTESGVYLYKKGTELMKRFRDIEQGVKSFAGGVQSFHIGYACGVINVLDVVKVEQFAGDHPEAGVTWHEGANNDIKDLITSGGCDAAFVIGRIPSDSLFQKILLKKHYSAVVYEGHPFYDRESLSIEDLKGEQLITLNENYQSFYNITERCRDFGFVPDIRIKTMESSLIYKYVAEKLGIGVDIDIHDHRMFNLPVRLIELKDSIPWSICFVCPEENKEHPVVKELIKTFFR